MRSLLTTLLGTLLLATAPVLAESDTSAGQQAYATCQSCHGAEGQGNQSLNAPKLTHLGAAYIASSLGKFRSGLRGGDGDTDLAKQMAAMAATLASEQSIFDVATYIDSLPDLPTSATVEGDPAVGADYYNQFCGACHGATAQGNAALNSPALAGGDDWYLLSQLEAFRSGTRGVHQNDRTGRQMRAMAALLPDDTLADVVAFIREQKP